MSETMLTVQEVAKLLKTSRYTVRDWILAGELEGANICSGQRHRIWRISPAAVAKFIESRTHKPEPTKQSLNKKRVVVKEYV